MSAEVVLYRIRNILHAQPEPLHVHCSNVKRSRDNDEEEAGSAPPKQPCPLDYSPENFRALLRDVGAYYRKEEALTSEMEALKRENEALKRQNQTMSQKLTDINKELECAMCTDVSEDNLVLHCGHHFCRPCLETWEGSGRTNGKKCPTCVAPFVREDGEWNAVQHFSLQNIAQAVKYTKIFPVDQKYVGDLSEDGLRHGQGQCFYANGEVYEGSWVNDERHGKGVITFVGGKQWEGTFDKNQKHGFGRTIEDGFSTEEAFFHDRLVPNFQHYCRVSLAMMIGQCQRDDKDTATLALFQVLITDVCYKIRRGEMKLTMSNYVDREHLYQEVKRLWRLELWAGTLSFEDLVDLMNNPCKQESKVQEALNVINTQENAPELAGPQ